VNVYVDPEDLRRVAAELGCRPSDAVRQLISNYLLAARLDEIRRLPGGPALDVFHSPSRPGLPEIPEDVEIEPVE
jgi:hypothetical protein